MRAHVVPVVLGLFGALFGVFLAAEVHAPVGPFDATFRAMPRLTGDTVVLLAPLGTLRLDTHDGPIGIDVRLDEIRLEAARDIVENPTELEDIESAIAGDARRALARLAVRAGVVALLGAVGFNLLYRRTRHVLVLGLAAAVALALVTVTAGAVTWRPKALAEPQYTGVLTLAPRAIGSASDVAARFDQYRAQLASLVANLTRLYEATESLSLYQPDPDTIRILHVSDLHNNPEAWTIIAEVSRQFDVDAIVDTGDISDWGTDIETGFVEPISDLDVPYLYVRGNHDSRTTQAAVESQPNAVVLDGRTVELAGLRFLGVGDPRFTPDQSERRTPAVERATLESFAEDVSDLVAAAEPPPVDVLVVHDPSVIEAMEEVDVPVVLAGHRHRASAEHLNGSLLLVEGSTGGAGLRTLEHGDPMPLTMSVLYFDPGDRRLAAYDRITVAGLGGRGVNIERHIVEESEVDTDADGEGEGGGDAGGEQPSLVPPSTRFFEPASARRPRPLTQPE